MKLGILVNTDRHLEHVVGLARAAAGQNHEVVIFAMDAGTRLMESELFVALADLEGVSMSLCDHSAREQGIATDGLSKAITVGSQLNNAMMNHGADRVIVL